MRQPLQHLWLRVQVSLGLFQVAGCPGFLQMYFRAVSAMCKRGANPDSLERLGSMHVPAWSCIFTVSPLISSWHWSLEWFMPPLAKLLEILPFLHFQCLCPEWQWSTAMAVGQLHACSWLLSTAHWWQVGGSTGQVHAMGTWSCQRPVSHMGVALITIAQALWAHRYKVGCTTANESAGRGWPEPAHHLRSTSNRNPRATSLFPAAAGGMALSHLQEESGRSLSPCPLQGIGKQARERVASGLSHSKQGYTNAIALYSKCYNGELLLW